jgi:hypothetical protein
MASSFGGYFPKNSNPSTRVSGGVPAVQIFAPEPAPLTESSLEHDEFGDFLAGQEALMAAQGQAGYSVSAAEFVTSALEEAFRVGLLPRDTSVSDSRFRMIIHAGFGDKQAVMDRLDGVTTEVAFKKYGKGICALLMCYLEPPEEPVRIADLLDFTSEE